MSDNPPPYNAPPPQEPYGQQPYGQQPYGQPAAPTGGSGLAITALVLGILALLSSITVIGGILFGLLALVFGFIASGKAKRGAARGRGMAITGIVLGVIGALISIVLIVVGASILNSDSGKNYKDCVSNANGDSAKVQDCADKFQKDLQN